MAGAPTTRSDIEETKEGNCMEVARLSRTERSSRMMTEKDQHLSTKHHCKPCEHGFNSTAGLKISLEEAEVGLGRQEA